MIFPAFRGFVRVFVILCAAVFVLEQFALYGPTGDPARFQQMIRFLGLEPDLLFRGMVYQIFTWVFLHGNLTHLLFNMFAFWMFGSLLEETFGTRRFIKFNLFATLVTAGVIIFYSLFDPATYHTPTIGASGLVFAILVAVARLYPNQMILFFFIFPMRMKYFAYLLIIIEFYFLWTSNNRGISNIGHLGGALAGYIFISWRGGRGGYGESGADWLKKMRSQWHQKRRRKNLRIVYPEDRQRYH